MTTPSHLWTFCLDCQPGKVAINRRDRATVFRGKGGKASARVYVAPEWKSAVAGIVASLASDWASRDPIDGPVRVTVRTNWPRKNRTGPSAGLPLGDVDATSKAVLDALAKAGIIHDDGQVVECLLRKAHGEPGIVVTVEPASTTGRPTP